jgi:hypothetical protein
MPGKPTGTASFGGLWVLLYVIQALAGEARVAGSISRAGGNLPCFMGWAKIVSMTGWSSIQAITRASPPHFEQIDTSILNTRFRRCAFMPLGAGRRKCQQCARLCENSKCCRIRGYLDPYPRGDRSLQRILRDRILRTRFRAEFSHSLCPKRSFVSP